MADQAKPAKPATHNGYSPDALKKYVSAITGIEDEMASEQGEYMSFCASKREEIKDIIDTAKDKHGIPKKAFKAVLKAKKLEAKAARARDELDTQEIDDFDLIRHALGDLADTPLGQAATPAQAAA